MKNLFKLTVQLIELIMVKWSSIFLQISDGCLFTLIASWVGGGRTQCQNHYKWLNNEIYVFSSWYWTAFTIPASHDQKNVIFAGLAIRMFSLVFPRAERQREGLATCAPMSLSRVNKIASLVFVCMLWRKMVHLIKEKVLLISCPNPGYWEYIQARKPHSPYMSKVIQLWRYQLKR